MVAYSFAPQFVAAVESLEKRQTVRAYRRRHARPGEPVQLYTGMRTKHCRKLVDPDPVCTGVGHIVIEHGTTQPLHLKIDNYVLTPAEVEAFAVRDGFGADEPDGLAAQRMAAFWLKHHGAETWRGVVVHWRPR